MATLVDEVWEDEDNTDGGVLLARMAMTFASSSAGSHFEAITTYYGLCRLGTYTSDFADDRDPYPDDWAKRQSLFQRSAESSM